LDLPVRSGPELLAPLDHHAGEVRMSSSGTPRAAAVAVALLVLMSGLTVAQTQTPTQTPSSSVSAQREAAADRLPVRRVVLYKSGVGYFEHLGRISGNQTVTIDFTSGQLDDALKSLTALDLGGGRIAGVNYNSEASLERRLGELRLPVGSETTRAAFLSALRGARLDVRSAGTRVVGRLLSVERLERRSDGASTHVDALSIVSDAGEIRTIALDAGVSVRIMEADLNQEIGRYLALVGSVRDHDVRRLSLATTGTGDRDLFVSYVSEVPVWKATYRLVLPSAGESRRPLLQGWAIVDNTVGQDWERVELSLVAGAPQSFVQAISQPYYVQRPVVPLPERVTLTPQTHQAAITTAAPNAAPEAPPPPASPPRPGRGAGAGRGGVVGGVAGGVAQSTLNTTRDGVAMRADAVSEVTVSAARAAFQAEATAAQLGDLFEYKLKEPVTIRKNQSALVPILGAEVEAERVSLWNPAAGLNRPLRAVWLTNATGLTLDGGSFSVIEGQAFAGEGLIEPLKAGERRLLSYAVDLGVHVDAKSETVPTRVTRVQINRGVVIQTTEEQQTRTYSARNEDVEPRVLVVEHPARAGWSLGGTMKPAETTAAWHRFRVIIDPKTTRTFTVEETRPVRTQVMVSTVTDDHIQLWVRSKAISPALETALREVITRKDALARVAAQIAAHQSQIDEIGRDQQRIRENMKSLTRSAEERALLQRYVRQLDEQENRLEALRKEIQTLTGERQRLEAELAKYVESIGT
jgi:hypothetical protein